MSFRKLNMLILAVCAALAISSCKDDDDTTVTPSLNGTLTFNVDAFVLQDTKVTLTPSGISHPDGKGIGYYWKVSPVMDKSDTTRLENGLSPEGQESDGSFTYQFPDSLGTYTVYCSGFAKGYTSKSATAYVTVVKPGLGGSITGTGISLAHDNIKVDGIEYYYKNINGTDWMRNNLANNSYGAAYANAPAMSNVLGRYYSHEEAMKACPDGWRLPTDKEWATLAASVSGKEALEHENISGLAASLMGDVKFNTRLMWEYWPAVGEITNSSEMAVIPAGYANLGEKKDGEYPTATFKGIYEYAAFWTADTVADEEGMAYYRYIIYDQPDLYIGKGDTQTFGANVRCVR